MTGDLFTQRDPGHLTRVEIAGLRCDPYSCAEDDIAALVALLDGMDPNHDLEPEEDNDSDVRDHPCVWADDPEVSQADPLFHKAGKWIGW